MKKKIKNTTFEERENICDKCEDCFGCPFDVIIKNVIDGGRIIGSRCNIYLNDNGTNLDKEIEVEEK